MTQSTHGHSMHTPPVRTSCAHTHCRQAAPIQPTPASGMAAFQPACLQGSEAAEAAGEAAWAAFMAGEWPLGPLCQRLCLAALSPAWPVRHGAAAGLREILRSHARCAGVRAPVDAAAAGGEGLVRQGCCALLGVWVGGGGWASRACSPLVLPRGAAGLRQLLW